jgi:hypothetical protein
MSLEGFHVGLTAAAGVHAYQGCWREIVERLKLQALHEKPVQEGLVPTTFYVLALVKLRQYVAAAEVLNSCGDLDAGHLMQPGPEGRALGRGRGSYL